MALAGGKPIVKSHDNANPKKRVARARGIAGRIARVNAGRELAFPRTTRAREKLANGHQATNDDRTRRGDRGRGCCR